MQIFKEIRRLLTSEIPFVCYIKPDENVWNLCTQQTDEIIDFIGQAGFIFMPFDEGKQVVIPFEGRLFLQGNLENLEKTTSQDFNSESNQKEVFENLVTEGISSIKNDEFQKVVLSRKIVLKQHISIVETFQNLITNYPTAFRYLFFHPKLGLWMGASPEQLVKINQNKFETVALAGTQLFSENVIWATKEVEEQQIVTDYIVSKLKKNTKNLEISAVKTIKAGNLAHLKSIISGELSTEFKANDLIQMLHPTPAVCGFPKEQAFDFILKNEGYDRKYYSGFLGEFKINSKTDLFVNLRCLEVEKDAVNIYVGCGITKDSTPEKEFLETENKSKTMSTILVFKP
mgnify:CR=1 FL=1